MHIDGNCHCGALAWEAEVDPASARICHCTDCQRLSGSPYRASVRAEHGAFRFTRGEPRTYVKLADSGNRRAQAFCDQCGTPVYATDASGPAPYFLRIGAIRQRAELVPALQMWCDSMLDWTQDLSGLDCLPGDL